MEPCPQAVRNSMEGRRRQTNILVWTDIHSVEVVFSRNIRRWSRTRKMGGRKPRTPESESHSDISNAESTVWGRCRHQNTRPERFLTSASLSQQNTPRTLQMHCTSRTTTAAARMKTASGVRGEEFRSANHPTRNRKNHNPFSQSVEDI